MDTNYSPTDRITAIGALYQAERIDAASMQTTNIATVGIAITYGVLTAALLGLGKPDELDPWVIVFLPLPLWIVGVFLGGLAAAQSRRTHSVLILERHLFDICGLDDCERKLVGMTAVEDLLTWPSARLPARISLLISFGGELLALSGYTAFMLLEAGSRRRSLAELIIPSFVYAGMLLILLSAWFANTRGSRLRSRKGRESVCG